MAVLVTGGSGFLGSYLIPELLAAGREVVVFDRAAPAVDGVRWIGGDLTDAAALEAAVAEHGVTDVFHLAAVLAGPCEADPDLGFAINFDATRTLLRAASRRPGFGRFVLISSISVFGKDAAEPVADAAAKNPATVYGQTKLACEHLLRWYAERGKVDGRGVRFAWVYGPGRVNGITAAYSSLLLDRIARGEPVDVPNPDEAGDWLYVRDAVAALMRLWRVEPERLSRRVYNVCGGAHRIRDVLEIARAVRPDAEIRYAADSEAASPYPSRYDDAAARRDWGWAPAWPVDRAVADHLAVVGAQAGETPPAEAGSQSSG